MTVRACVCTALGDFSFLARNLMLQRPSVLPEGESTFAEKDQDPLQEPAFFSTNFDLASSAIFASSGRQKQNWFLTR